MSEERWDRMTINCSGVLSWLLFKSFFLGSEALAACMTVSLNICQRKLRLTRLTGSVLLIGGVLIISRLEAVRSLSSIWDLKASQCSVVHFLKLKTVLCSFFCLTRCKGSWPSKRCFLKNPMMHLWFNLAEESVVSLVDGSVQIWSKQNVFQIIESGYHKRSIRDVGKLVVDDTKVAKSLPDSSFGDWSM